MSFGDEKVVVDVKDVEQGEIEYTDNTGQKHTYYPCSSNWLVVKSLEVQTELGESQEGTIKSPVITRVRGVAELEDRSLSVIGDSSSKTKTITISLNAGSTGDWRPREDAKDDQGFLSSLMITPLGGAVLGFNRADWEIGNESEWWVSCYVPAAFLSALVEDIRKGQLTSMNLGLALKGLYTTVHSYAPISMRGDLFIRPNPCDNTIEMPKMATGYVRSLHCTSAKVDFRKAEPIEDEPPLFTDEEMRIPAHVDPVANALEVLNTRVEKLRGTLKWVGGLVFVALLILASK